MDFLPFTMAMTMMIMAGPSYQMDSLEDVLVYPIEPPANIQKRDTAASTKSGQTGPITKFVEDQLLQQGQALEHLVKIARRNQELTNTLIENLSSKVAEPVMPEKVELLSRRSFNDAPMPTQNLVSERKNSPWCSVAIACRRTLNPVCGFDDSFGYGKFDDICHMLQVNCYWKYNFGLVPNCKPTL